MISSLFSALFLLSPFSLYKINLFYSVQQNTILFCRMMFHPILEFKKKHLKLLNNSNNSKNSGVTDFILLKITLRKLPFEQEAKKDPGLAREAEHTCCIWM